MERYALTLSRVQYLHKLFITLLQGRFMSFPLFIYLFLPLYFFVDTSILAVQDAPGSCYVFLAPVLESTCPRDPSSFYWTMILENNIQELLGVLLLQDQLTEQVCVYTTYINVFLYTTCISLNAYGFFNSHLHYHMDLSRLLFLFCCNILLQHQKPGSLQLLLILFIFFFCFFF